MNALITLNSVFPINVGGKTSGGIEVYAVNVAEYLATKLGWSVDVISSKDSTSSVEGVNMIRLSADATKTRVARGERVDKFDWKDYMNVVNTLAIDQYDLILVCNHYVPLLQFLNDHAKGKVIIQYNQILPRWKDCKDLCVAMEGMPNVIQAAISDLICLKWNELGGRYFYLPYGFIDKFTGNLDTLIDYRRISMACRIIAEKNPRKLIRMIRQFNKTSKSHDIVGDIVGHGDKGTKYYDSTIELSGEDVGVRPEYSGDNVKWINYLSENTPIVISLAHIEALGITPIEAFMCGLPCYCVWSPLSAVSETISRGSFIYRNDHFIVTELGAIALQEKYFKEMVEYCINNDPFDRSVIRKHFEDNYTIDSHINNLLRITNND